MRLARLVALALLLFPVQAWPAQAWAFDWFGLRSGMTLDQVRAVAPAGSTLRLNGDFGLIEKGGEAVATVTFCKGRLIALSRTIDAQSDWFTLADRMIKQYGAPKVTPASDPWAESRAAGPKADVSKGLELSWRSGWNKYALTGYPAAQPGPGQGRALASLSVADLGPVNACVPRRAAGRDETRKASFVRRAKHVKPRLPPIGGTMLNLTPAAARREPARAASAPRPAAAAPAAPVKRAKRANAQLPPIGGAKLNLTPAAAPRDQAPAARAPRPAKRTPGDAAARETPAPIDPASVRGRILRFFGYPKERFIVRDTAEDR